MRNVKYVTHSYSFITKSMHKLHENVCKYCHLFYIIMLQEDSNILRYNQDNKYFENLFVIYAATKTTSGKNSRMW